MQCAKTTLIYIRPPHVPYPMFIRAPLVQVRDNMLSYFFFSRESFLIKRWPGGRNACGLGLSVIYQWKKDISPADVSYFKSYH